MMVAMLDQWRVDLLVVMTGEQLVVKMAAMMAAMMADSMAY